MVRELGSFFIDSHPNWEHRIKVDLTLSETAN